MTAPIVVVTGGSAGVGRAVALTFARHGWRVAVLARGEARLDDACAQIRALGAEAMKLVADVADPAQVEAAADEVERRWGPIAVWVNNAMATVFGDLARVPAVDFRRATEVTYLGAVWGTQAALRHMRPRNRGCIVQVGSALAYRSIALQSAYCGAKSALRGFTDALRLELLHARSAVRVTMVHLPACNTPQFDWSRNYMDGRPRPLGWVYPPDWVARAIYRAAAGTRREHWVGLPAALAIVGARFAPGWFKHTLAEQTWHGQLEEEGERGAAHHAPDNLFAPAPGCPRAEGRFGRAAQATRARLVAGRLLALGALLVGASRLLARTARQRDGGG
ncbi:SDR family oxidoreductase [Azoarcus olearius]|uniref:Short-chain dehydrogenase family protein n=1 Tax=Azoarcus sp. (strain BH72) TaxID=418699 RepID=A1K6C2_AZOSB|nr:SDR family oxidoreductase [Azoarcus olearius]CAL94377.1 Short-chain dehydrogenase family protein [Azoarcus olearius]